MANPENFPYGSWKSPIKANLLAAASVGLGSLTVADGVAYWLEGRPLEGGRFVLVRRTSEGSIADLTPPEFNVRTTVHEYGGGAYLVHGNTVYFSNFADQRLYAQRLESAAENGSPETDILPLTPEPLLPRGLCYADSRLTPDGRWLVCVRECHQAGVEAVNELVILPPDGKQAPRVIAAGHDFYADPRPSPDGRQLAWLCWDHPNMPWDGTELWVADFIPDGMLSSPRRVAGGRAESIFQPKWSPAGVLHFVSDRTGWWNLYRLVDGVAQPLAPMEAEFGQPQWAFGLSNYVFLPDGRIACLYSQDGYDHLGLIPPAGGRVEPVETGCTLLQNLAFDGARLWMIGASPQAPASILAFDLADRSLQIVRVSTSLMVDPGYISIPQAIQFPTENGLTAHAFYYPPANRNFAAPPGEKPPLLVLSHGGPTSNTKAIFNLGIQYWTSRGFGVVDVNYGGSSGYGRAYRQRLNGNWGLVDVLDCINAARYLAGQGAVDPQRIAVRGGSAGGYTTLCGLAFHKFFAAGASHFGVADLIALDEDTHKFESRYNHSLIGPYPEKKELYIQRSPVHYAHQISCPVILFQGLEDKVVPPAQSEAMVAALAAKGVPHAYIPFDGEQHGFRKAETIQRAAEAELYFYSRVFGFGLAEPVEPVEIKNL
jgi:dipeptidyl aminopeptidase/acylaminoacyl peptidase